MTDTSKKTEKVVSVETEDKVVVKVKKVTTKGGAVVKAGSVKRTKIFRDSIQGITKPAIRRICNRAGVKRKSGPIYEELRGVTKVYMESILRDTITMTIHNRRRTVKDVDLIAALQIRGVYLEAGTNPNTHKKTFEKCKSRPKSKAKTAEKAEKDSEENSEGAKPTKTHRFKPGTVALREIRYQQKNSDSFAIPKTNFGRIVREIAQDFGDNFRFSGVFLDLFQVTIEDMLVKILVAANKCAIHVSRQTVTPSDIRLAREIREERF